METEIDRRFLLEQLELQIKNLEEAGDKLSADMIRVLIVEAGLSKREIEDSTPVNVNMTLTLKKFNGEIKEGDKPVETIVF